MMPIQLLIYYGADLNPERTDFRTKRANFKPEKADLMPAIQSSID